MSGTTGKKENEREAQDAAIIALDVDIKGWSVPQLPKLLTRYCGMQRRHSAYVLRMIREIASKKADCIIWEWMALAAIQYLLEGEEIFSLEQMGEWVKAREAEVGR